jgi:hypothetical protein
MIHVIYTEPSPFGAMLTDRQYRSADAARRFVATIADGDVPYLVIDGEFVNEEWTSPAEAGGLEATSTTPAWVADLAGDGTEPAEDRDETGRAERETLRDDDDQAEHDAEAAYDAVMRDHR